MVMNTLRTRARNWVKPAGGIFLFAVVGLALVLASHAATPVNNAIDPELGATSGGASVGFDSTASNGSYVSFAAPVNAATSLTVDASQSVASFDRRIKGIGLANWTFQKSWGKPYVGDVQGLPQLVKAIDPGLIRYAGGLWANYVGFDNTSAAQHAPQTGWVKNGQTYYYSYGMDELKSVDAFAKSVNADVMIQVNISNNDPQMWADLATFVKNTGLTSIKYYEFGNELDLETANNGADALTPAVYGTRLAAYQKALLAVDPSLNIVGGVSAAATDIVRANYSSGGNSPSQYMTQALSAARGAGKDLNTASFHWYEGGGTTTITDILNWTFSESTNSTEWWREAYARDWSGSVGPWLKATALSSYPTTQLGVSELGVNSSDGITYNGNFTAALWYSDVLGRLAYTSVNWITQWDSYASTPEYFSLMYPDNDQTTTPTLNIRPSYYAYVMYSKYFGDKMVNAKTYDPTKLSIWASTDSRDPGKLKLRITNLTDTAITTPVVLSNFGVKTAVSYVLSSTNPTDSSAASTTTSANVTINGTKLDASAIEASIASIKSQTVTVSGNAIQTTFPAYSSMAIIASTN